MKRVVSPAGLLLLLILNFSTLQLAAQVPALPHTSSDNKDTNAGILSEELYLHIDRDRYIAGENLWFSIFALDGGSGKLSSRSAVAYVELLNPWNIPVIQERLNLSGGRGEGNFVVPDSVSSGTYTVRAYTNWMKNFLPVNCFTRDIEVLNPFRDLRFVRKNHPAEAFKADENISDAGKTNFLTLNIDSVFGKREKVTLKLKAGNNNPAQAGIYDLSVSVSPASVSEEAKGIEEYLFRKKTMQKDTISGNNKPLLYNFESEGHYLNVLVKYREENAGDSSDYLYMSIQGKVAEFRYAARDKDGRYSFILPADSKQRNLILQPEHANKNMVLEIEPSFSWVFPASEPLKDSLTESETEAFSKLSFNYQAQRIYGIIMKKETEASDKPDLKKRRFYGIPEMEIYLDDYISLPSMQEVFFELLPGINIRSRKSGYEMQITNPMTGTDFNEPPLVMIDGVIINDLKLLVDLNPELVEKIEVVKTPYLIGDLILYGIINVITRSGDFSSSEMPDYAVILPYRVVEKSSAISLPDYSYEEQRLSRKPDLRNTLYWNPSVRTGSNGEAEIEFWTSDLPGTYTIVIEGVSETGNKVSLRKLFTVTERR